MMSGTKAPAAGSRMGILTVSEPRISKCPANVRIPIRLPAAGAIAPDITVCYEGKEKKGKRYESAE